jgi:hypothetical protein
VPVTWDTFEGAGPSVVELEVRTDNQILDSARDEHLAWSGESADSCPDVHADTGDIVGSPFDFASVKTGAHLDAERMDGPL